MWTMSLVLQVLVYIQIMKIKYISAVKCPSNAYYTMKHSSNPLMGINQYRRIYVCLNFHLKLAYHQFSSEFIHHPLNNCSLHFAEQCSSLWMWSKYWACTLYIWDITKTGTSNMVAFYSPCQKNRGKGFQCLTPVCVLCVIWWKVHLFSLGIWRGLLWWHDWILDKDIQKST